MRQLAGLPEYDLPPIDSRVRPPHEFETVHMPMYSDVRRQCALCYKNSRRQIKVNTYCSAPQCGVYLHLASRERSCFQEFHSKEYHRN